MPSERSLVIEGQSGTHAKRVRVVRRNDSHKDLMILVRQLAELYRHGWRFDEVWVQFFEERK